MSRTPSFKSNALLDPRLAWRGGTYAFGDDLWQAYSVDASRASMSTRTTDFVVPALPVEFHCHGVSGIDFSDFKSLDLDKLEKTLRKEGVYCVPTLYLPRADLEDFLAFMEAFSRRRQAKSFTNILGIALEGPLFSCFGGTPRIGVWAPTKDQWRKLAECGPLGLLYMVLSPDAMLPGSKLAHELTPSHPTLEWIVQVLLENGVRPALGHFLKTDPAASAACVEAVFATADRMRMDRYAGHVVTDHLFNDMPCNVRFSWRRPADRVRRDADIAALRIHEWTLSNLPQRLGPVPATIVQGAIDGHLAMCINFDGEHVDLDISKRIVELVGSRSIVAMTDRCESNFLGGQKLTALDGGSLLYQADGIVAAGSQTIDGVMKNMSDVGMEVADIWEMAAFNPLRVLGLEATAASPPHAFSYVTPSHGRIGVYASDLAPEQKA